MATPNPSSATGSSALKSVSAAFAANVPARNVTRTRKHRKKKVTFNVGDVVHFTSKGNENAVRATVLRVKERGWHDIQTESGAMVKARTNTMELLSRGEVVDAPVAPLPPAPKPCASRQQIIKDAYFSVGDPVMYQRKNRKKVKDGEITPSMPPVEGVVVEVKQRGWYVVKLVNGEITKARTTELSMAPIEPDTASIPLDGEDAACAPAMPEANILDAHVPASRGVYIDTRKIRVYSLNMFALRHVFSDGGHDAYDAFVLSMLKADVIALQVECVEQIELFLSRLSLCTNVEYLVTSLVSGRYAWVYNPNNVALVDWGGLNQDGVRDYTRRFRHAPLLGHFRSGNLEFFAVLHATWDDDSRRVREINLLSAVCDEIEACTMSDNTILIIQGNARLTNRKGMTIRWQSLASRGLNPVFTPQFVTPKPHIVADDNFIIPKFMQPAIKSFSMPYLDAENVDWLADALYHLSLSVTLHTRVRVGDAVPGEVLMSQAVRMKEYFDTYVDTKGLDPDDLATLLSAMNI